MTDDNRQPFDSIESAQEFMALICTMIEEAVSDVSRDREEAASAQQDRRVLALDLALYKLKCLDKHVHKSGRLLNDLRAIRRLLFSERPGAALAASEPAQPVLTTPAGVER